MSMTNNLTRRRFLRAGVAQSALLAGAWPARAGSIHGLSEAAAEPAKAYPAADQIGLALIGAGGRDRMTRKPLSRFRASGWWLPPIATTGG